MATRVADLSRPVVVTAERSRLAVSAEAFQGHAARAVGGAGAIFLIGSVLDVLVLWIFQRQPGPQFEFTALASTAEAMPRLVLACALLFAALYLGRSSSLLWYRVLALLLIVFAMVSVAIGGMMITDYFVLRREINPEAARIFTSSVLKTVALCGLYVVVLVPIGIMGLRRPRGT